jgi:cytochrome b561
MSWHNTPTRYGRITKLLHWLTVVLFSLQYTGGLTMSRMDPKQGLLGLSQNDVYNWHKSLGLVILIVAAVRLWTRRQGQLPDWAPGLSRFEHVLIHRYETLFYVGMFLMPVSGFLFVMAGGYGVLLFGLWPIPNPIGKIPSLASLSQWVHFIGAWLLAASIMLHVGLVLRHQVLLKDRLLQRMLRHRGNA